MSEKYTGGSQEKESQIKQMVVIQEMDKLLAEGRLTESGRRMVDDLKRGDIVKVHGTNTAGDSISRLARVVEFNRPPSKKDLIIDWTIELIEE